MSIVEMEARSLSVTDRYELLAGLLVGRTPSQPVASDAEWMELVALAQKEGVGPLLHRAVCAATGLEVPASAHRMLAVTYFRAVDLRLQQEAARQDLCRRLGERQIPALLLKGAALALTCYEDPATRPMVDLDVLVPRGRVEEAGRCLGENGFRLLSASLSTALRSPRGDMAFTHGATGTLVELHWELNALGRLQEKVQAEIWSEPRPVGSDGAAQVMRPGHALPLLCAHMIAHHQYARLLWLFDLHRVLLTMDAAEAAVAQDAATRWRLVPCTALALLRVRTLFATPLPGELHAWAREAASRDSLGTRMAALALTPGAPERPDGDVVNLVMNRSWSMLRIFFPSPSALRERVGLPAHQSVIPAYAALMGRHLRNGPAHLRRLWRSWRAVSRTGGESPCSMLRRRDPALRKSRPKRARLAGKKQPGAEPRQ